VPYWSKGISQTTIKPLDIPSYSKACSCNPRTKIAVFTSLLMADRVISNTGAAAGWTMMDVVGGLACSKVMTQTHAEQQLAEGFSHATMQANRTPCPGK